MAASIKKPFELRYNPYTQSVQALSSSGKIMDIAKELKGDVFLIANAIRKMQVCMLFNRVLFNSAFSKIYSLDQNVPKVSHYCVISVNVPHYLSSL